MIKLDAEHLWPLVLIFALIVSATGLVGLNEMKKSRCDQNFTNGICYNHSEIRSEILSLLEYRDGLHRKQVSEMVDADPVVIREVISDMQKEKVIIIEDRSGFARDDNIFLFNYSEK